MPNPCSSPQVVYDEPAEQEEDDDPTPEYPLVLFRPPLHHPNGVSTDPQGIGNSIQSSLGTLQYLPLLSQIAQHRSAPIKELIELFRCLIEECVLSQHMTFAIVVAALWCTSGVCVWSIRSIGIVGPGRCEGGMLRRGRKIGLCIGVFGRGCVVWTATEQFCARFCRLLQAY
jgi:hypothetical protein